MVRKRNVWLQKCFKTDFSQYICAVGFSVECWGVEWHTYQTWIVRRINIQYDADLYLKNACDYVS